MFTVKLTIGLGPVKTPVVYTWDDVSKGQIVADLEDRLLKGLMKLNDLGDDMVRGRIPKATTTDPVEMVIEFLIEEDGEKWHRTTLEYPNMGDEQQAMFLGVLAGELATLPKDTAAKRGKGKDKQEKDKPNKPF